MTLLLYRLIFVVTLLIDNDIAIIQTDFCSDFINW